MFWKKNKSAQDDACLGAATKGEASYPTHQKALESIVDAYHKENIVALGYVQNLRSCDGNVAVDLVLPTPPGEYSKELETLAKERLRKVSGTKNVEVHVLSQIPNSLPNKAIDTLSQVKNLVAVSSGKGGVGKSTVSVNLAMALAKTGAKVGLMDADVYGPSVPKMLDGYERPQNAGHNRIQPLERYGIHFMSMALLTDPDTPVIWRGPMATKLIQHFLGQVEWGALDYLLIDLPPGTGDVQLTLTQSAPLTGAVIVTTPQEVAVNVTMRGIRMFDEVNVPILGVIENMSGFACPHCHETTPIFRQGGGEETAKKYGMPFLGKIPIDPALAESGDFGHPLAGNAEYAESPTYKAFASIAEKLTREIGVVVARTSSVKITAKKISNDAHHILVDWEDGLQSKIAFRKLRLACPCAECVDEWTHEKRLDPRKVPLDIKPLQFRTVGRYGVQITWSDQHSTGIYTYNTLREIETPMTMDSTESKGQTTTDSGHSHPSNGHAHEDGTLSQPSSEKKTLESESKSQDDAIREKVIEKLKTVYDPEIPVNIYDLGLIYALDFIEPGRLRIEMTLTTPNCPAAEQLPAQVQAAAKSVDEIQDVEFKLVWEPPWNKEMMSETARVTLGL